MLNAHCSMLNAHCSLLIAHCSMLNAHCSLLNAHCNCSLLIVIAHLRYVVHMLKTTPMSERLKIQIQCACIDDIVKVDAFIRERAGSAYYINEEAYTGGTRPSLASALRVFCYYANAVSEEQRRTKSAFLNADGPGVIMISTLALGRGSNVQHMDFVVRMYMWSVVLLMLQCVVHVVSVALLMRCLDIAGRLS